MSALHVLILSPLLAASVALAGTPEDLARADALYEEDQVEKAKALVEQVLGREPDNAVALFQVGRIAMDEEEYDRAIKAFKRSTELARDSEAYRWLGHAYVEKLQRSNIFKKKGLAGKAKKCFLEAVAIDPANIEARVDYYMKYEEWENAEVELEALIGLSPEDATLWFRLGRLYQDTEEYQRALAMFEKSWATDPEYINALYQIGRTTVIGDREYVKGEAAFREYFTKSPDETVAPSISSAHWRMGMLYELQGQYDEAKQEYKTALELDPDNDNAKDAYKELKRRTGKLRKR